jgi:anti-anti-sigma regulatory factor
VFTALFDLTGARTLVGTARLLTEVGVRLRLTGAQPLVARVLQVADPRTAEMTT